MIEYMSTVILAGCGPWVCVASNNTQQRLRRQTEEDWGLLQHYRRGERCGGAEIWKHYGKEREKERLKKESDIGNDREGRGGETGKVSYALKLLNYYSNSGLMV